MTYYGSSSYKGRFSNHKRDWRYYNNGEKRLYTTVFKIFDKAYENDGSLEKVAFTHLEDFDALVNRQTCVAKEMHYIRNNPCVNLYGKGKGIMKTHQTSSSNL
jgi:hypothetical protein